MSQSDSPQPLPVVPRPQMERLSAYLARTAPLGWHKQGRDWKVIADAVARLERVYDAAVTVVTMDKLGHFDNGDGVTGAGTKALDELAKAVRNG